VEENTLNISAERIGILVKLGLTPTQAKMYLSLVTLGKSRAKTLTKFSMISRQDAYQTLNELFEMSLLEKTFTKPAEFQAIPPKLCLELLTQRRNRTTTEINQTAKKIFYDFKKRKEKSSKENQQIMLIPKEEPVLLNAKDLVKFARKTIRVITPIQKMSAWIQEEADSFLNALNRNIKLQFITDFPKNTNSWQKILAPFEYEPNFEMKYIPNSPLASFGIYDSEKILLELCAEGNYLGSQVIITENTSIIEMASSHFELMWSQAKKRKL
jgi:sugar-specific transcriptional regulator TrmB